MKKQKLIWQIFPLFLIIIIISLSLEAWYFNRHSRQFFLENTEKELMVRARLIEFKITEILSGKPVQNQKLNDLCRDLGESIQTRVTVVAPSGEVMADSLARTATMENHKNRPEIQTALTGEKGVSIRYSRTLDQNMMYFALPVEGNTGIAAVIRTAIPLTAIEKNIRSTRNKVFGFLILTVIAAAGVSWYVTRKIIQPLEAIKKGAQAFARGDLSNRLAVPDTEELSELARSMNQMAENLTNRIQEALNRQRELEAVHASMQEGVIAIDNQEKIITINDAAARIFNFPAIEMKNKNVLEVARNYELQSFIRTALSTHEPVEDDILIHQDKDHILNIHSSALWDSQDHRMGTLIIFHDITRIRRLEKMHKDFAANVSHELKTPLTTLKGFIETLQEMPDSSSEDRSGFLKILEKNVNRMIELINDLLSLSRLERLEGTGVRFADNQLFILIQGAVAACGPLAEKKQIQIQITCPQDLTVRVDPVLMEQAIVNLVENAVKYSLKNSQVDICARSTSKDIQIDVRDAGPGIAKEHLPKIFNRFYRVDKGRSRQEGGTGLGLAIVKHIIQYHNGQITVSSVKGKGTVFHIRLPSHA
ncbi:MULTISPECIES: ATP-binding protein [Desulfotignum]|jgi:two-component system phosphate regulon sensor histidine kinase PhoR|uniref:histidine kinase n=1 Tax=Desulfotignum phosphitoxidans DSM 13687 TaxID=1286635 RepID=S0G7H8_9BACT|nr:MULTISPECIES: ATP-binding protein [Desulfotignum]EMS81157.1 alkaline phosphatase synthesis sensor protein PhoR [Desulfotignum phosphitoxidans DSM 13687]